MMEESLEEQKRFDLSIGQTFRTYEELENLLKLREREFGEKWVKGKSVRTVKDANSKIKSSKLHFKQSFVYSRIVFQCPCSGEFKSRGTQNKFKVSHKIGCEAKIRGYVNRKADVMVIQHCHLQHNHDLSKTIVSRNTCDQPQIQQLRPVMKPEENQNTAQLSSGSFDVSQIPDQAQLFEFNNFVEVEQPGTAPSISIPNSGVTLVDLEPSGNEMFVTLPSLQSSSVAAANIIRMNRQSEKRKPDSSNDDLWNDYLRENIKTQVLQQQYLKLKIRSLGMKPCID